MTTASDDDAVCELTRRLSAALAFALRDGVSLEQACAVFGGLAEHAGGGPAGNATAQAGWQERTRAAAATAGEAAARSRELALLLDKARDTLRAAAAGDSESILTVSTAPRRRSPGHARTCGRLSPPAERSGRTPRRRT